MAATDMCRHRLASQLGLEYESVRQAVRKFMGPTANFIIASNIANGAYLFGKAKFWAPPSSRVLTIPHLAPSVLQNCEHSDTSIVCPLHLSKAISNAPPGLSPSFLLGTRGGGKGLSACVSLLCPLWGM